MKTETSNISIALFGLLLAAIGAIFPFSARAADNNQGVDTQAKPRVEEQRGPAKKTGRDPVAAAFQLPSGTVLSKQQRAALQKLKEDNSPDLQQAFDDMAQAKTASQRNKAQQDIRDVRSTIRSGLNDILSMNSGGTSTGQSANGSSGYQGSGYGYAPYFAAQAGYYPGFAYSSGYGYPGYGYGYPGYYGNWAYGPHRHSTSPYYYNGTWHGTASKPATATNSVAKPATQTAAKPASKPPAKHHK